MRIKTTIAAVLGFVLMTGGAAEAQRHGRAPAGDLVQVATSAGSFKTLLAAAQAAGLVETLKGSGPLTVFAPTDAAFAKLPAGTVERLLQNPEQLRAILAYHVVPGKVLAADVVRMQAASTVQGAPIRVSTSGRTVKINDSTVLTPNVMASNGVIHVIDTVLMPPAM
jgi:uncharacterized surface protein with fasciclin (FAS1) repeats